MSGKGDWSDKYVNFKNCKTENDENDSRHKQCRHRKRSQSCTKAKRRCTKTPNRKPTRTEKNRNKSNSGHEDSCCSTSTTTVSSNAANNESHPDCRKGCGKRFPKCLFWMVVVLLLLSGYTLWILRQGVRGAEANFALSSMGATISTKANGVSCAPKHRINDPKVIISGLPVIPGNAFCFEGPGEFIFDLSAPIFITGITYEHIPKEIHPEHHIKSAPTLLLVYGITKDAKGNLKEDYIDNLEYLDNGKSIQTLKFKAPNFNLKYSQAKISVLGSHGLHFTCLYRIQIHGELNEATNYKNKGIFSLW